MKRLISAFALFAAAAQAAPVYYTFTGTVSYAGGNPGYVTGTPVTFTILVDRALDGYTVNNGFTQVQNDIAPYYDYFYTDFVGGNILTQDLPGPVGADYHYGVSDSRGLSLFNVDNNDPSGNDVLSIRRNGTSVDNLTVGTQFSATHMMFIWSTGWWQNTAMALTLTGISDVNPLAAPAVPEPATMALLGLGLAGLGIYARRRKR